MSQNVEQSLRRIEIGEDTFFFTETKPERQLTVSFERQSSADPFISYEIIGANASQVEVDIERNTVNELGTRIYKSFTITARAKDPVVTSKN